MMVTSGIDESRSVSSPMYMLAVCTGDETTEEDLL